MNKSLKISLVVVSCLLSIAVQGQTQISMPQVANLPNSSPISVVGAVEGKIFNGDRTGMFLIKIDAKNAPPGQPFPIGTVYIKWDRPEYSKGNVNSTAIYQLLVVAYKDIAPMLFVTGRGTLDDGTKGCVFWIMIANEGNNDQSPSATGQRAAPDVISFIVADPRGRLLSYGAGAVVKNDIKVQSL